MMATAAGMAAEYTLAKGPWCSTPCPLSPSALLPLFAYLGDGLPEWYCDIV